MNNTAVNWVCVGIGRKAKGILDYEQNQSDITSSSKPNENLGCRYLAAEAKGIHGAFSSLTPYPDISGSGSRGGGSSIGSLLSRKVQFSFGQMVMLSQTHALYLNNRTCTARRDGVRFTGNLRWRGSLKHR